MPIQKVVRSAKTGRFVKKSKAKTSPKTTVTETIAHKKKAKKKKPIPKKKNFGYDWED